MHQRKIKGKIKNRMRKPSARANKRNTDKRRKQIQKNFRTYNDLSLSQLKRFLKETDSADYTRILGKTNSIRWKEKREEEREKEIMMQEHD